VAFIFSALGIAPNAYLTRNLMVKQKTIIAIAALSISGVVAITMALKGYGYWSLATQQVVYNATIAIGRYVCTRWHPTLDVNFTPVRQMFGFSVKVLITAVLTSISNNVLTVILGRLFPKDDVGNYYQANKWSAMAYALIANTVAQVAQPVLAQVNDENERQRRVFRKMLRFTAFLSFPAMFGLALVAPQLIIIAIGDKWAQCIPLLQVLCISGAFMPFYTIYQHLFLGRGQSNIYMWLSASQIVLVITSVLACSAWGIHAMVVAFAVITILWLLAWQMMAQREMGLRLGQVLRDTLPFMVIAAVVVAVTGLLTAWISSLWMLLVVRVAVASILYYIIMRLLHVQIVDECLDFVRSRLHRQPKH